MRKLQAPFQAIDQLLADRVCHWHQTDNALLWQTVAATSLALQQGHSCLNLNLCHQELPFKQMRSVGGIPFPEAVVWQQELSAFNLSPESESPLIIDNSRAYLRRYWQFETELAEFFKRRHHGDHELTAEQLKQAKQLIKVYFPSPSTSLDHQKLAAMNCVLGNTNIIIGGPGTGKTYTVTRILALLAAISDHPPLIKLAAPTGKAAQRLAEAIRESKQSMNLDMLINDAIPNEAHTLHRLLGVIPNQIHFRHHADNPIEADILLIDEVSMVDLPLMTRLCRALKPTTQLILLGDADQLPSVAAGSVLAELVRRPHPGYSAARAKKLKQLDNTVHVEVNDQNADHVTELVYSRRFSQDSGIGKLAHLVITGNAAHALIAFNNHDDIDWQSSKHIDRLVKHWTQQFYAPLAHRKTLGDAFTQLKQFRILCAVKEGKFGVQTINESIVKKLNPNRATYYQGQPIMVTQNHYGLKLFNGDIGLVWPDGDGRLMAWFEAEHEPRAVALGRLPAVDTVYAMTIHKTQGSEFNHVALVLPDTTSALVTRELIYTGLTRAKQSFSLVGEEQYWLAGVTAKVERWAGLAERIERGA